MVAAIVAQASSLFAENGLFENLQIAMLAVATAIFATAIRASFVPPVSDQRYAARAFSLFFIVLPAVGVLREVSFGEEIGLSRAAEDAVKLAAVVFLLSFWGAAAWTWWVRLRPRFHWLGRIVIARPALWFYAMLVLFLVSNVFERNLLGISFYVAVEEALELASYACVVLSAWAARRWARG